MFDESISNLLNVGLAVVVTYLSFQAMQKATGAMKTMLEAVKLSAIVLGVAELLDMMQVFPDGTYMSGLIYEKEIVVLALLLWGVLRVKGKK